MTTSNSTPIKVTHLLHTMAYGGIETVIINWLININPEQVKANLIVFANPGNTEEPFILAAEEKGLHVETIPWGRGKPILKATKELGKLLDKHQTQILHTHNAYADIVGLIAGKRHGAKTVSTIYVWEDGGFGIKRKLIQQIDAWVLRRFDLLTAQCEKTIQDSADWGFDPEHLRLQPSGFHAHPAQLSPDEREKLRAERGAQPDQLVVCNVARFFPEKAQDLMLRCWAKVIETCPGAVLWLYGIGPIEEELRDLAQQLKLEKHIQFMGFAKDLALELELCDIQFHPAHNEGIPLAICSGMAAGLPILASKVGGLPEVIKDNHSGLLIEGNDEEEFTRQMIRLIQEPQLRQRLGEEAFRFIKEEYSLEFAAEALEKTYQFTLTQH
jgi:glycosyltransferase involved in cell wall biosynthesis